MNPLLIAPILEIGKDLIDRIFPDKVAQENQRAAAQLELLRLTQSERMAQLAMEHSQTQAQTDINKIEASSDNMFVAGWRPFIGWVGGLALATQYLIVPLIAFGMQVAGKPIELPKVDFSEMMAVLFAILGLGAYRTIEKIRKPA